MILFDKPFLGDWSVNNYSHVNASTTHVLGWCIDGLLSWSKAGCKGNKILGIFGTNSNNYVPEWKSSTVLQSAIWTSSRLSQENHICTSPLTKWQDRMYQAQLDCTSLTWWVIDRIRPQNVWSWITHRSLPVINDKSVDYPLIPFWIQTFANSHWKVLPAY